MEDTQILNTVLMQNESWLQTWNTDLYQCRYNRILATQRSDNEEYARLGIQLEEIEYRINKAKVIIAFIKERRREQFFKDIAV